MNSPRRRTCTVPLYRFIGNGLTFSLRPSTTPKGARASGVAVSTLTVLISIFFTKLPLKLNMDWLLR